MPRTKTRLTERQSRFIDYYLAEPNATKAAAKAGYSKKTAQEQGHQVINKPWVQEEITRRQQKRSSKLKVTADWVLEETVRLYKEAIELNHLDDSVLYNKNGSLKPIHEWPEVWRQKQMIAALENIDLFGKDGKGNRILRGYLKKVRLTDHKGLEDKLLKMIGEHVGVGAFNSTIHAKITGDASADAVQVETLDLSKLSTEELIAYRAIRKKAAGVQDEED